MLIDFDRLPRREKAYMIESFGLSEREAEVLRLRYVDGLSYSRIAAEMNMSEKSVGNALMRARKHMVEIAKACYPLADERLKSLIDTVGWVELEWPTLGSRKKKGPSQEEPRS